MPVSPENIYLVFAFILPGFILQSMIGWFVPRSKQSEFVAGLQFLKLGVLNLALCSPVVYLLLSSDYFLEHPVRSALAWFAVLFVVPAAAGLLLGHLHQNGKLRTFVRAVGFSLVSPIPTSWDYVFTSKSEVWVLVTLKDGGQLGGFRGRHSFASSDGQERDIFLETVFKITNHGEWKKTDRSSGILIRGDEIRFIEFFDAKE